MAFTQDSRSCADAVAIVPLTTHSLRGEGFDASEDGTGRGTPLVPVHAFDASQSDVLQYGDMTGPLDTDGHSIAIAFDTTQITSPANYSNPQPGDPCHPPAIAFSSKDHGADASSEVSPTLRAMGHADSHANGGGQMAVAFAWQAGGDHTTSLPLGNDMTPTLTKNQSLAVAIRGRDGGGTAELGDEVSNALRASQGGGDKAHVMTVGAVDIADTLSVGANQTTGFATEVVSLAMQVRRLTPRECERLQGFPDDWTLIPVKGKPAADGPRYKAIGNSMAVPCMRWIGERIDAELKSKKDIAPSAGFQEAAE